MNRRRKFVCFVLALVAFVTFGASTTLSASAASYDENYQCAYEAPKIAGSPNAWRICDGTWYHAYSGSRTAHIKMEIQYNANTGQRWEGLYYAANLDDRVTKTLKWYCRLSSGGTSGSKGTTTLGPNTSYSWTPQFNPCDPSYGYGAGMIAVVTGTCFDCNQSSYTTSVYVNDSWSGAGWQRGIQNVG
jgi:hypothetical protein